MTLTHRCTLPAAAVALSLLLPSAARAQGGFTGPGGYEITNLKSGKVLELSNQAAVVQSSARNTDSQVWLIRRADPGFYFILNAANGAALSMSSDHNSAPVMGMAHNSGAPQQWRIDPGKDGNALIVNRVSGKALDIPDGSSRDGLRIQIYDLNGDSNQRFTLRRVSGRFDRFGLGGTGTPAAGQRITCSSDSGSRVYCNADTAGARVQMVRQISGSPCREGETWGYDARGIWVDRGCRAEFEVTSGGSRRGLREGIFRSGTRGAARTVTCSSDSGGRVHCNADTSRGVRLVRQISGSPCTEGSTWGTDSTGIWVTRGCRAEFELAR